MLSFVLSRHKIANLKELIVQVQHYGFRSGLRSFLHQKNISNLKLNHYHSWFINKHLPDSSELDKQRIHKFTYEPLISIIVPTYNTPRRFLIEMIESVIAQTYLKWELCIADGASSHPETLEVLRNYSVKDSQIKVLFLSENFHISGNTNQALTIASGDYIGFFDHDDILTPNCLYEYVKEINQYNKPSLLYCDEDKVSSDSKFFSSPTFKPDFAMDTLRVSNYICHWLVIRKDILDKVGEFDTKCNGAQDYDMVLRVVDVSRDIIHIPMVLYHWRTHAASTAAAFGIAKPYTHDAGILALTKHLKRNNLVGKISAGVDSNIYKIDYALTHFPIISIVIPIIQDTTKLQKCLDSIYKKTTYQNYEIILAHQSIQDLKTDLSQLQNRYPNLKLILCHCEYESRSLRANTCMWNTRVCARDNLLNISAMNNLGVSHANGEYLVFIDSNTEVITPNWLEEMLMFAARADVGAVGAKLYYPDNKLYNGGLILGVGSLGVGVYAHHNMPKSFRGYNNLLYTVRNLSAVALNGMMIEKSKLCQLAGFDENYKIAFSDIDLSIRLKRAGYLIVWTPFAELLYNQTKHLNYYNEYMDNAGFSSDLNLFTTKYGLHLNDPYYNINFSRSDETYTLDTPRPLRALV